MPERFAWTDQNVDRLRQLFADGLSSGQIATEMGVATRNAVIGKLGRLGLRHTERVRSVARPRRFPVRKPPQLPNLYALPVHPVPRVPAPAAPPVPSQPCSLLELLNESCRWPCGDVGTPGFFFCGAVEADLNAGVPYCRAHSRLAYAPRRT